MDSDLQISAKIVALGSKKYASTSGASIASRCQSVAKKRDACGDVAQVRYHFLV